MSGHPAERLWRKIGLPEYFLGNGGSNVKLYEFYDAIVEQCAKVSESYYSGAEAAEEIRALSYSLTSNNRGPPHD